MKDKQIKLGPRKAHVKWMGFTEDFYKAKARIVSHMYSSHSPIQQ